MPLVRIDVNQDTSADLIAIISEVVYQGMIRPAKVPEHDRFQIVTRHASEELIYPKEGYLGIQHSRALVYIQVTWLKGRTKEQKQSFYAQVVAEIVAKGRIRAEDVFISLVETGFEDWSFGQGLMQYSDRG